MFLWQMIMGVKCNTVEWLDIARLSPNSKLIKPTKLNSPNSGSASADGGPRSSVRARRS
jgi:hypothetical protein